MKITDFEYDGLALSDLGYMVCSFSNSGIETKTNPNISLNLISVLNGNKNELVSYKYDSTLTATFSICKSACAGFKAMAIPEKEYRDLVSWLQRKKFYKLKLLNPQVLDLYLEATFDVSRIEFGGELYGLELTMKTNRPYALHEPITIELEGNSNNWSDTVLLESDDEGFQYPVMTIQVNASGDLTIVNDAEDDREMVVKNCTNGEVITVDYPIISTSNANHKIQDDFNWKFFRFSNTFYNKKNVITSSLPCKISLSYSPIVKIGI